MNNANHSKNSKFTFFLLVCTAFLLCANIATFAQQYFVQFKPLYLYILIIGIACTKLIKKDTFKLDNTSFRFLIWLGIVTTLPAISLLLSTRNSFGIDSFIVQAWIVVVSGSIVLLCTKKPIRIAIAYGILWALVFQLGVHFVEFINPDLRMFQPTTASGLDIDYHGRVTGMHKNPNTSATALVLSLFICQFLISKKWRIVLTVAVGCAVLVTVSRGGLLCWILSVCFSYLLGLYGKPSYQVNTTLLVGFSLVLLALLTGQIPVIIYLTGLDNFISDYSIAKLSGGFLSQGDTSSSLRMELAYHALDLFRENPIVGAGVGESELLGVFSDMGSHNMYLKQAAELGILGICSFLALALVPAYGSKYRFYFVILYLFSAVFNHTSIDYSFYAVLLPFGVAMLPHINFSSKYRCKSSKRNLSARQNAYTYR